MLQKAVPFGMRAKHIVDIEDLEKVDAEAIENKLMWMGNVFD